MGRAPGRPSFLARLPLPGRTEGLVILVILLVAAIAVGASAWYASTRTTPTFEPPRDAAGPEEPTTGTPVLAIYGDRYVSGTEQGGQGAAGWPALVSQRVGAEPSEPHAVPDGGYVAASDTTGDTFLTLAEKAPEPTADVTIVFGSRNDYLAEPAEITEAATRTIETIRATAPETKLLIIGPAWTDAAVPPELPPVRDAVQRAATAAGATFVDPLAERWFFDDPELIGLDIVSPTDEGHVYLADRIEPFVRQLMDDDQAGTETAASDPTS